MLAFREAAPKTGRRSMSTKCGTDIMKSIDFIY